MVFQNGVEGVNWPWKYFDLIVIPGQEFVLQGWYLVVSPSQMLPPCSASFSITLLEDLVPPPHVAEQAVHPPHWPQRQFTEGGNMVFFKLVHLVPSITNTNRASTDTEYILIWSSHTWARIFAARLVSGCFSITNASSMFCFFCNHSSWRLSSPSTCCWASCPSTPLSPKAIDWRKKTRVFSDWSTWHSILSKYWRAETDPEDIFWFD